MEQNETKRDGIKRIYEIKTKETKRNRTKWNETKQGPGSICRRMVKPYIVFSVNFNAECVYYYFIIISDLNQYFSANR